MYGGPFMVDTVKLNIYLKTTFAILITTISYTLNNKAIIIIYFETLMLHLSLVFFPTASLVTNCHHWGKTDKQI